MIAIEHEQMGYLTCKLTKTNAVADGSKSKEQHLCMNEARNFGPGF